MAACVGWAEKKLFLCSFYATDNKFEITLSICCLLRVKLIKFVGIQIWNKAYTFSQDVWVFLMYTFVAKLLILLQVCSPSTRLLSQSCRLRRVGSTYSCLPRHGSYISTSWSGDDEGQSLRGLNWTKILFCSLLPTRFTWQTRRLRIQGSTATTDTGWKLGW